MGLLHRRRSFSRRATRALAEALEDRRYLNFSLEGISNPPEPLGSNNAYYSSAEGQQTNWAWTIYDVEESVTANID